MQVSGGGGDPGGGHEGDRWDLQGEQSRSYTAVKYGVTSRPRSGFLG